MTLPLIRYALDPTGVNPDNLVVGETHTLSTTQVRAVAPTYGAFYTESLQVWDNTNNRLLVRGIDYQCVELLQEATLRYGKEISLLVLILNQTVSSVVRLNYQTLGGLYQNNASGIVDMYNALIIDNRPVDWVNVLNKPLEFPPPLHNHLLQDVYGFESVVVALERVRNAIVLSDVPAFEDLIDWVKRRSVAIVSEAEIDAGLPVAKMMTLERLMYALDKFNFNAITITPTISTVVNGTNVQFSLSTTKLVDNTVLYWSIEHGSTTDNDFNALSGPINVLGNRAQFSIPIASASVVDPQETFNVIIRKNSPTGPELARTSTITIQAAAVGVNIMDYFVTCCLFNPAVKINPTSMFIMRKNRR